jgi:Domain of unknown function (DUF1772)
MRYDGPLYARINNSLYRTFGTAPGITIEIGSLLAASGLAFLVRARRPAFPLTLASTGLLILAQAMWWAFIYPVNTEIRTWTAGSIPADWVQRRNQWEYTHATRFALQLIGFSALVLSVLREPQVEQAATVPMWLGNIRASRQ